MNTGIKKAIIVLAAISAVMWISNLEVSIRTGVDGRHKSIKMPLYVKWVQFLARHYEYARISKEITENCDSDEKRAIAILAWTGENIKVQSSDVPIIDDHISHIIIREHGTPEQLQDVFTTLCTYRNIPAFVIRAYDTRQKTHYALSFVRLNGKWCVFDASRNTYFFNSRREIASIDDVVSDPSIMSMAHPDESIPGVVRYGDLLGSLKNVSVPKMLRAKKQMPLQRILFELMKACGIVRETDT